VPVVNRAQAKAAIVRLLGHKATWRYNDKAPKAEERAEIRSTLAALAITSTDARAVMEARRAQLLKDTEYCRLVEAFKLARDTHSNACSRACSYRVTIGKSNGLFNMVVVEADNWQDAIDALKRKVQS